MSQLEKKGHFSHCRVKHEFFASHEQLLFKQQHLLIVSHFSLDGFIISFNYRFTECSQSVNVHKDVAAFVFVCCTNVEGGLIFGGRRATWFKSPRDRRLRRGFLVRALQHHLIIEGDCPSLGAVQGRSRWTTKVTIITAKSLGRTDGLVFRSWRATRNVSK